MIKYTAYVTIFFCVLSCSRTSDKDFSLTPQEYQAMGLSDHSSVWNYEDYKEACAVLNNIKAIKPFALPKKDSRR
ncbi:MAG: hypothetical protein KFF73_01445, partial [Cyclobacteriaceae bacterium]|nr:hypothetical protein [Cyclobacteriaceae bacterium]